MTKREKVAVTFCAAMALGFLVALLFPAVREGTASSGITGAFGVPMWAIAAAGFTAFSALIVLEFVNVRRRRNGRPPL